MEKSDFLKKLKTKAGEKAIELIIAGIVIVSTFFIKSGINTGVQYITTEVKKELEKDRKLDSIKYSMFVDSLVRYAAPVKGDVEFLVKAENDRFRNSLDLNNKITKISSKVDSLLKSDFSIEELDYTRKEDIEELVLIMKEQQQILTLQQRRDSIMLEYDKEKQRLYEQSSAELKNLMNKLPR